MEKQRKFPYQYFVVTFLWTWLCLLPLVLAGNGIIAMEKNLFNIIQWPLSLIAVFGPAAGAFYCLRTRNGKGAIGQYLRGLWDFKFGWQAWLVPILLFGTSSWLAWVLPEFWGEPRLPMLLPSIWLFPPWLLLMTLLGGGQEELGWRGYILDPLEERLGPWLGNLVLGGIWAVWHLPLFIIPGTPQIYEPFAAFLIICVGYAGILAWVRQASGKRLMAGIYSHGLANAVVPFFPTIVTKAGVAQSRIWIWASLLFAMGVVITIIRTRKTTESSTSISN